MSARLLVTLSVLSVCLTIVWRLDSTAPKPPTLTRVVNPAWVREVGRRNAAKAQVVSRLLQEKLTLLQAAGWFRRLDNEPAYCPSHAWEGFPGHSDEEKLCREVICWAVSHTRRASVPDKAKALERQLEGELRALLCKPGGVVLPQP